MDFEAYVGRLSADETKDLLQVLLNNIDPEALIDVLSEHLTIEQIDELQERLP